MPLSTLQDLLPEIRRLGHGEAVLFDNGFRTWRNSHFEIWRQAAGLSRFLAAGGLKKGERLVFWSENRPEWVSLFWACVAAGVEVVPVDCRSSPRLLARVCLEVQAKLVFVGESVDAGASPAPTLTISEISRIPPAATMDTVPVQPEDVVQIVYTSGTTGEPRGVIHRHRNICANLDPFQREISRYRHYARPFQPVRILTLLPLSHMFGQSLAIFIPVLLGGSAAFATDLRPSATMALIRRERISVLAAVPRMANTLKLGVQREFGIGPGEPLGTGWWGAARRWWRFRAVHRRFGFKFWAFVLGGAAVPPELEAFWRRLGFAVVQGYGLTESSPVIAVNHPFDTRQGSIGKAVEGQTVRLAPDGEILVRGESVATERLGPGAVAEKLTEDGWLHTGDIGSVDNEGRIYYKGRKKDVIVSSSGMNVFPQDVEAALNRLPEVRESVVVGRRTSGEERVHAVLMLRDAQADPARLVARANNELEAHQRVQGWSVWPESDFPRTASTLKIKRMEVAAWVNREEASESDSSATAADPLQEVLSAVAGRPIDTGEARLTEDLGFTSLDRVELLTRLEDRFGVSLDEEAFSRLSSVSELRQAVQGASRGGETAPEGETRAPDVMPRWGQSAPVRWFRTAALNAILLPSFRILIELTAEGLDELERVAPPAIFAANHNSHFDVPSILAALPLNWRNRIAPAMLQDYFLAHFRPAGHSLRTRLRTTLKYWLACGLFGAYPLPHRLGGVRETLHYTGELAGRGLCPVVFPEGVRSRDGRMQPFKPGIGLMAARLQVPVVPVHISGAFEAWSQFERLPTGYGKIHVKFGKALRFEAGDPESLAARIERAVQELADSAARPPRP